jgi:hypothetical protein
MTTLRRRPQDGNDSAAADTAVALAAALREFVRVELRAALAANEGDDGDPWIDHRGWPFGSRRANLKIARSGGLDVRRSGRLYLARRSEIDRFVDALRVECPAPAPAAANAATSSGVDEVLADLGLERVPRAQPPRRRGPR